MQQSSEINEIKEWLNNNPFTEQSFESIIKVKSDRFKTEILKQIVKCYEDCTNTSVTTILSKKMIEAINFNFSEPSVKPIIQALKEKPELCFNNNYFEMYAITQTLKVFLNDIINNNNNKTPNQIMKEHFCNEAEEILMKLFVEYDTVTEIIVRITKEESFKPIYKNKYGDNVDNHNLKLQIIDTVILRPYHIYITRDHLRIHLQTDLCVFIKNVVNNNVLRDFSINLQEIHGSQVAAKKVNQCKMYYELYNEVYICYSDILSNYFDDLYKVEVEYNRIKNPKNLPLIEKLNKVIIDKISEKYKFSEDITKAIVNAVFMIYDNPNSQSVDDRLSYSEFLKTCGTNKQAILVGHKAIIKAINYSKTIVSHEKEMHYDSFLKRIDEKNKSLLAPITTKEIETETVTITQPYSDIFNKLTIDDSKKELLLRMQKYSEILCEDIAKNFEEKHIGQYKALSAAIYKHFDFKYYKTIMNHLNTPIVNVVMEKLDLALKNRDLDKYNSIMILYNEFTILP